MTAASAATRLRVDSSRVIWFINHGLITDRLPSGRLLLQATRKLIGGRWQWDISAKSVRQFSKARRKLGL